MDVEYAHFWAQLVSILKSISEATFITIDVEMGGISIRRPGINNRSHTQGKPTLQQQYEETKEAAETYQVLQLGITCVKKDLEKEMYVALPYNFNVSPLFLQGDKLEIHRDITFSSSAIHFLMRNSFDVGAVFTKGVPYLSREEEVSALQNYKTKQESQSTIPDIVIPSSDIEAHKFYDKAKKTISDWFLKEKPALEFVNIGCYGGLNGYQRRLVHQLVRNEFKGYRTFARNGGEFMQVEKADAGREAQISKVKLQSFESGLGKQIGLRFIIEALVGGDLTSLDPKWFCVDESGNPAFTNVESVKSELRELEENLKKKSHVLVGHNLFTDLIFLYRTFIGALPDTVTEFNSRIHALFPQVIDTKYLATHESGSMQKKSTLKDLCDELKDRNVPFMVLAEKHTGYGMRGKEHEAGYDSWMTAQVLVKLSSKLAAENSSGTNTRTDEDVASKPKVSVDSLDNGGCVLNPPDTNGLSQGIDVKLSGVGMPNVGESSIGHILDPRQRPDSRVEDQASSGSILDLPIVEATDDANSFLSCLNGSDGGVSLKSTLEPRESSLMDSDVDDGFKIVSKKKPHLRPQIPSRSTFGLGDVIFAPDGVSRQWHAGQLNKYAVLDPEMQVKTSIETKLSKWMPDLKSKFWKPYINRLRVYGTEDEICHLGM